MRHDHVVPGAEGGGVEVGGELLGVLVGAGAEDDRDGRREDADGVVGQVGGGEVVRRDRP